MIRRVWRPRYLELDENGILRYYEASSPSSSPSSQSLRQSHLQPSSGIGPGGGSGNATVVSSSSCSTSRAVTATVDREFLHVKRRGSGSSHGGGGGNRIVAGGGEGVVVVNVDDNNNTDGRQRQQGGVLPTDSRAAVMPRRRRRRQRPSSSPSPEKEVGGSGVTDDIVDGEGSMTTAATRSRQRCDDDNANEEEEEDDDDAMGVSMMEGPTTTTTTSMHRKQDLSYDSDDPEPARSVSALTTNDAGAMRVSSWDHLSGADTHQSSSTTTAPQRRRERPPSQQQQQQQLQKQQQQQQQELQRCDGKEESEMGGVRCSYPSSSSTIASSLSDYPPTNATTTTMNAIRSTSLDQQQQQSLRHQSLSNITTPNTRNPPPPQQPHQIHEHRPKAIMSILSARTIDGNALRDIMHIGLPKHQFGFVFRGQPLFSPSSVCNPIQLPLVDTTAAAYSNSNSNRRYHNSSNSTTHPKNESGNHQQQHHHDNTNNNNNTKSSNTTRNNPTPSSHPNSNSLPPLDAALLQNQQEQICRSLSILATEHDYFATSREYLCAVSTLEEAESWVVALRWAAEVTSAKKKRRRRNMNLSGLGMDSGGVAGVLFGDGARIGDGEEGNSGYGNVYDSICAAATDTTFDRNQLPYRQQPRQGTDDHEDVDMDVEGSCLSAFSTPMMIRKRKEDIFLDHHPPVSNNTISSPHRRLRHSYYDDVGGDGGENEEDDNSCLMQSLLSVSSKGSGDNIGVGVDRGIVMDRSISSGGDGTPTVAEGGGEECAIAVPKVTAFQLRKRQQPSHHTTRWWCRFGVEYDVVYEVHILVLPNVHLDGATDDVKTTIEHADDDDDKGTQPPVAEERTILRSYEELVRLVDGLLLEWEKEIKKDDGNHNSNNNNKEGDTSGKDELGEILRKSQASLRQIHTSVVGGKCCSGAVTESDIPSSSSSLTSVYPFSLFSTVSASVEIIDTSLRALATHGQLCNTAAMRAFLCLSSCGGGIDDLAGMAVLDMQPMMMIPTRKNLRIKRGQSSEEFVKRWLFGNNDNDDNSTDDDTKNKIKEGGGGYVVLPSGGGSVITSSWNDAMIMFLLMSRNPWIDALLWSMRLLLAKCACGLWIRYISFSVMCRMEILIAGSSGMFYCGYWFGGGVGSGGDGYGSDKEPYSNKIQHIPVVTTPPTQLRRGDATPKRQSTTINNNNSSNNIPRGFGNNLIEAGGSTTGCAPMPGQVEDEISVGFTSGGSRILSCPLPRYQPNNDNNNHHNNTSCWSQTPRDSIFRVRGINYLNDRIKLPSAPSVFPCRGVDVYLTDDPIRHISRHPAMLGGKLHSTDDDTNDTFVVNFLLPFANFVSYFSIPPIETMPKNVAAVWTKFLAGDVEYRDARLKLLPVVIDGPWIVKKAVGTTPAVLGQKIPLQYYFTKGDGGKRKGTYEVDVIISASKIAKTILNVVKGHAKRLIIALAFIIEAAEESELPETVLCSFQIHYLHLELCPRLPYYALDVDTDDDDDDSNGDDEI